ncbi:MAG: hypothetical protein H8E48_04810 [Chloroflexi bacterium]|nr:hypothetical protein [Chloroflexota bacterium]
MSGIVSSAATTGIMVNGGGGNTSSNIDVCWDGPGLTGTGIALNTTSGNALTEVTVNNRMYGVHLYQAPDNRISCGTMSGSSYAFYVQSNSGNTSVNLNSIAGNLYYGINNETGLPLNAESNYWGSPDGPNGAGDAISANVDADPFVSDPEELNAACGRFVMVGIDVKPGGDANSINMRAKGVVSVAILTTSVADGESLDFDAVSVDQATVTFAGASPRGKGKSGNIGSLEDVDGDGDLDLVLQFPIPDLALTPGDSVAELEGQTLEGTPIRGSDSVTVR